MVKSKGVGTTAIVCAVVAILVVGALGAYFLTKKGTPVTKVELTPVNTGISLGFQVTVYATVERAYLKVYDPSGSAIASGVVKPSTSGATEIITSDFPSHSTCIPGGSPGGKYRLTAELPAEEILYQKNFVFTAPNLSITSLQLTDLRYVPNVVVGTLTISALNMGDFPAYVFGLDAYFDSFHNGGYMLGTSGAVIIDPGSSGTINTTVIFNTGTIDGHQFSPGETYSVHFVLTEGSGYVIGTTQTLEVTFPT